MARVLILAEHDGVTPSQGTLGTLGAAAKLGHSDVAVLAGRGRSVAAALARIDGVDRVLLVERPENSPMLAAVWAPQIAALAVGYTHVLAPATTFGKDLLPRVAALLDCGMLSDIVEIDDPLSFRRPVYAGNAVVRIKARTGKPICAGIRTTAFAIPETRDPAPIESVAVDCELPTHTRWLGRRGGDSAGPDLQTASRVVAAGRGLGGSENLRLVEELAAALGAAIGASRAAVDSGWVANELQVGQTGKIIAPDLYIGIGISGAIQHLTGIKDAGTIVAINKDAEAPICALADLVLVDDLFSAVPALTDAIRKLRPGNQGAGNSSG